MVWMTVILTMNLLIRFFNQTKPALLLAINDAVKTSTHYFRFSKTYFLQCFTLPLHLLRDQPGGPSPQPCQAPGHDRDGWEVKRSGED